MESPIRRCLVIDRGLPTPRRDAGSARTVSLLRAFAELGFAPTFLPIDLDAPHEALSSLQGEPFAVATGAEVGSLRRFLRREAAGFQVIVVCRVGVADRLLRPLRRWAPEAALLFDTVDLHFLREGRRAGVEGDRRLAVLAGRLRRKELGLAARADLALVTSGHEMDLLAREAPEVAVWLVPPTCETHPATTPFEGRRDLLFVGGFAHLPNVDGVRWFAAEVLDRVAGALPGVVLRVVGPDAPSEIAELSSGRLRMEGFVEDLGPVYDSCRLSVAPLRYGAGVKLKVLESLSWGLPCVATPVAVEGTGLTDGQHLLVAENPAELASAVIRLYQDAELWQRLAAAGRARVGERFSPGRLRDSLRGALTRVGVEAS